jgi:hypothetical protein
MEVIFQLHIPSALLLGKESLYLLGRRLSGPQSLSGRGDKEKNSVFLRESNPGRPALRPVSVLTELSRLIPKLVIGFI